MNLKELKNHLSTQPDRNLRFVFPDGDLIEPDFHVTEVGLVTKKFIDCGGTRRSAETCVLQTWVAANDKDHRLNAGKLLNILQMAEGIFPSEDLAVEIEYEGCVISQYPIDSAEVTEGELRFTLDGKHTDCLDKEACGLQSASSSSSGKGCC